MDKPGIDYCIKCDVCLVCNMPPLEFSLCSLHLSRLSQYYDCIKLDVTFYVRFCRLIAQIDLSRVFRIFHCQPIFGRVNLCLVFGLFSLFQHVASSQV